MRDVYYQSVGNPVQFDRLPTTRPEIELLAPSPSRQAQLSQIVGFALVAAAAVVAVYVFYRPPGISWLEPLDLLVAWPLVVIGLALWTFTGQIRWLLTYPFLVGVGLLALNHHTPWGREVVMVSIMMGVLVYAFGRDWITRCTASPVLRSDAQSLHEHLQPQLVMLAGVTALLVGSLLWTGAAVFYVALLALPVTVLVVRQPSELKSSRWQVMAESLSSWFTYQARPIPGVFQGARPIGQRQGLTFLAILLAAIVLNRWPESPLHSAIELGRTRHEVVTRQLDARDAGVFERMRYGGLNVTLTLASVVVLPIAVPLVLAVSAAFPVLIEAAARRAQATSENSVASVLTNISWSANLTERNSIYLGRVVADGSPVLVPRKIFGEHAHALGDSGSGKTSLFLCPIIEQLARSGDCSLIVIDLKGDSLELLASLQSAAEQVREQRGLRMPLKLFSNQADRATFAFNPMAQPFWSRFDLLTRTDILCAACGLSYGADYGQGFYSSANAAIFHHALKTFPQVANFSELAECIGEVLVTAKKSELHPEIRKAGVHVHEVMKRLAACAPLNVTNSTDLEPAVRREAIDLLQLFQEPQMLYFHLPATLSPSAAPEIARLANYMLLAAATESDRKVPVFLVIDEFQRMVASNLEYMLQLARSMGVGVILANQSLEDLKKSTTNLIPTVEANCRLRQWFALSCSEDQERLMRGSGVSVDYQASHSDTVQNGGWGGCSESDSLSEQVVNRVTINDVLLTTDHPFRSFLRISRGAGYAQYGGMPVIIESSYHISPEEYEQRRKLPWPTEEGTFVPRAHLPNRAHHTASRPKQPQWSSEVIGESQSQPLSSDDLQSIDGLFEHFKQDFPDGGGDDSAGGDDGAGDRRRRKP